MKKRILIVIPTWERPHAIWRLLSEEVSFLDIFKVDICIYDSSTRDDTYKLVCGFKKEYKNVIYERVNYTVPSNEKYFDICQKSVESKYEYLWIVQDHLLLEKEAIQNLLKGLDSGSDFYYLNMFSDDYSQKIEDDLNSFAINSAWMLTRFGTAVFRTDTFLKGIDWDVLKEKWLNDKTVNNAHVGFFFERLAEMETPKVETLSFKRDQFYDFMRFQPVAWDCELLRICLECWGMTIDNLPDIYDKEKIMQSQDALFISNMKLLSMKSEHRYGVTEYEKYKRWIHKIYPKRDKHFKEIAYLTESETERKYLGKVLDAIGGAHENHCPVYIYGAGRHGTEFASYLDRKKISFEGFLVSKKAGNPNNICGHHVYEASEKIRKGNNLIIIAVAKGSVDLIKEMIYEISDNSNDVLSLEEVI